MVNVKAPGKSFLYVMGLLGERCARALTEAADNQGLGYEDITEIRLRRSRCASLSADRINIPVNYAANEAELSDIIGKMCRGSVYAYTDTILQGFIPLEKGCRAGICGNASAENGAVCGLNGIYSVNIRISKHITGISGFLLDIFSKSGKGILIYSAPAVGKTTLLRDFALNISSGANPKRLALIDTRCELDDGMLPEKTLIDVMRGYPKAKAVELAVRTLSPEIIVCDEIGDESECRALLETAGSGVPIIASAHGKSLTDLLSRPQIKRLFENGVFEIALGIERKAGSTVFEYEICEFEEGKACCTRK